MEEKEQGLEHSQLEVPAEEPSEQEPRKQENTLGAAIRCVAAAYLLYLCYQLGSSLVQGQVERIWERWLMGAAVAVFAVAAVFLLVRELPKLLRKKE